MEIDTTLFSNQLGTYGMETMKKIVNLSVFIYGMRGLGVEITKNIILSGARKVTIYDNSRVTAGDLNSNFFISEEDIDKSTRAEASLNKLKQLNSSAEIKIFKGELANNFQILDQYKVVIISELIAMEMAESLNEYCRSKKIAFIYCACLGVIGFTFNDFGDDFIVYDSNGEETKQYFIRNISKGSPGIVVIDNTIDHRNLEIGTGDFVTFKEVSGMTELNETPPRPVRVLSPCSFSIEDTSKFQDYNCSGIVEEVKIPKPALFKPLREAKNQIYHEEIVDEYLNEGIDPTSSPESSLKFSSGSDNDKNANCITPGFIKALMTQTEQIDQSKPNYNEKIHLAILSLHEFFDVQNSLPHINKEEEVERVIQISHEILTKAKKEGYTWALKLGDPDDEVTRTVARWARIQISPICSFLGGIIGQEVVKITGKYTPIEQWLWFNFYDTVKFTLEKNKGVVDYSKIDFSSRYNEQLSIIGQQTNTRLQNLKVLLIGCGAIGNELLKIFSLMGVGTGKDGLITIADDDIIERTNLNPQFLFNSKEVGQRKAEKCKENLLKNNGNLNIKNVLFKVNEANDKEFSDEFWQEQDIIIVAVDNYNSRKYVDKKCTLFHKILIDLVTLGTKGHCQLIIPFFTSCYNDEYIPEKGTVINQMFPTCIEHCIEWGRNFFIKMFTSEVREINLLLKADRTNIKQIFDSFNNQAEYTFETIERIERFKKVVEIACSNDFEAIVDYAVEIFQKNFEFDILRLLSKYPSDCTNDDGSKFWSGAKRQPQPVRFDLKNQKHFIFISLFSILLGKVINFEAINEKIGDIKEIAGRFNLKEYKYQKETKTKEEINKSVEDFFVYILNYPNKPILSELIFDKKNDENQQVNFIMTTANVRGQNYRIGECDFLKAKMCAGKFQPTAGTATASISGIASMQILTLCQFDIKKGQIPSVAELKNCYMNLGINYILLTELSPKKSHKDSKKGTQVVKSIPSGWMTWDTLKIENSYTLAEFVKFFSDYFHVKITKVIDCHFKTISAFSEEELSKKLEELFYYGEEKKKCLHLEVNGFTEANEIVEMPIIEYIFK